MNELKIGDHVKAVIHGVVTSGPDGSGELLIRRTDVDPNVPDGRSDSFYARPEELTRSPRPEPMNLGAVVEVGGRAWTRVYAGSSTDRVAPWTNSVGERYHWARLIGDAQEIKTLSDGIEG